MKKATEEDYKGYIESAINQDKHEAEMDKKMEHYYDLKCPKCGKYVPVKALVDDVYRCPVCNNFMQMEDE